MQLSVEQHLAVERDFQGRLSVQDVECARVYHVNTVMEIRTQVGLRSFLPASSIVCTCCKLYVHLLNFPVLAR